MDDNKRKKDNGYYTIVKIDWLKNVLKIDIVYNDLW